MITANATMITDRYRFRHRHPADVTMTESSRADFPDFQVQAHAAVRKKTTDKKFGFRQKAGVKPAFCLDLEGA